jgi:hypothetical protein
MDLQVIGAGFGRTSTLTLKLALEQLGFGPCYHMMEVFSHPGHAELWEKSVRDGGDDWKTALAGYKSSVDWPSCHFWREQMEAWPNAKVILTEREPHAWYKSMSQTILPAMARPIPSDVPPPVAAQARMGKLLIEEKTFGGDTGEAHVLDVYRAHNAAVRREVPADKLLVFDASQGWEPLCRFLGVPVPATPFPKTNSTEEFRTRARL